MAKLFNLFKVSLEKAQLYLAKQRKLNESRESRRSLLRNVDDRLNRVCVAGKLNGLNERELLSLIIAHLHEPLSIVSKHAGGLTCKKLLTIAAIIVFFGIFAIFPFCEPCKRVCYMFGRKILFQLEPHWDWQEVYHTRCLLPKKAIFSSTKKSFKYKQSNKADCGFCEDIHQISFIDIKRPKPNQNSIEQQFAFNIANKIPFIFQDYTLQKEIKSWPMHALDQIQLWQKLFSENKNGHKFCMFQSNLVSVRNPIQLFGILTAFQPENWMAHWENCGTKTMKTVRRQYVRPTVLPAMVELSKPSWILLSRLRNAGKPVTNVNGRIKRNKAIYKQIKPMFGTNLLILIQIKGSVKVRLTPLHYDCVEQLVCMDIENLSLTAYQMLIVNTKYWQLSYRPKTTMLSSNFVKNDTSHHEIQNNNSMHSLDNNDGVNLSLILAGVHV